MESHERKSVLQKPVLWISTKQEIFPLIKEGLLPLYHCIFHRDIVRTVWDKSKVYTEKVHLSIDKQGNSFHTESLFNPVKRDSSNNSQRNLIF